MSQVPLIQWKALTRYQGVQRFHARLDIFPLDERSLQDLGRWCWWLLLDLILLLKPSHLIHITLMRVETLPERRQLLAQFKVVIICALDTVPEGLEKIVCLIDSFVEPESSICL